MEYRLAPIIKTTLIHSINIYNVIFHNHIQLTFGHFYNSEDVNIKQLHCTNDKDLLQENSGINSPCFYLQETQNIIIK